MKFDNAFDVPLPPPEAWRLLLDIRRIAPCMPGAELTEIVDERSFKGKVAVRLGPVALTFAGAAHIDEIDAAALTARVIASGADAKGRGGARAAVHFAVRPAAAGARVLVATDLTLSGAVAQYGRGAGMIQEVAGQIVKQFAQALKAELAAREIPVASAVTAPASPPPAKPISGLALLLRALWSGVVRLFSGRSHAP